MIKSVSKYLGLGVLAISLNACKIPSGVTLRDENKSVPSTFQTSSDTVNSGLVKYGDFFKDQNLVELIDSALLRNQELNIILQEINQSNNEILARKGAYLPTVNGVAGMGVDKVGKYTSQGASDAANDITPGKKVPDALGNFVGGAQLTWEVDIWKKLRNAKQSAVHKYLASIEGKNFMVTHLVSEIAASYYELQTLDLQLETLNRNIQIQQNALEIVKVEKDAARTTELAVKKFEAEVLKNQSLQFHLKQRIVETENRINFLVGRFPQPVKRSKLDINSNPFDQIKAGIPSQLLQNRPDIRQAEQNLLAAKLNVKVARAEFYPSVKISSGTGFQAFNPKFLFQSPESMIFNLAGDLVAPLVNRRGLIAEYRSANNKQIQAVFTYEQTILNAFTEVVNQLNNIENNRQAFELKSKQVQALNESIEISTLLFRSARADYMEVLLTQRDAVEASFDLIEVKMNLLEGYIQLYRSLGGGAQ